jgi:hypothetical protein
MAFATFLKLLLAAPRHLMIVEDFIIHVDGVDNSFACQILFLISSFDLMHHVNGTTHDNTHWTFF